jgi:cytoskeletal protein RodZ
MAGIMNRIVAIVLIWLLAGVSGWSRALAQTSGAEQSAAQGEKAQAPAENVNTTSTPNVSGAPSAQQDKPTPGTLPDAPSAAPAQTADRSSSVQQPSTPVKSPSGTAAATMGNPQGALASKPAGAAIAPVEQHRTRSLLIKLGLIAGAGAALGSVIALSHGSPSRPPGAP